MNLELWPDDLLPEAKDVHLHNINFEHFKPEAQQALLLVGRAVFYRWAREGYQAVYPPKGKEGRGYFARNSNKLESR